MESAEKFKDVAAIVTGARTAEELLAGKIIKLNSSAASLGIQLEMIGKEALEKML